MPRSGTLSFVLLSFFLLPLPASAQFSLAWQKGIGLSGNGREFGDLTCVSPVDGHYFIGYTVTINGKEYPGLSVLYPADSLVNITDFSGNKDLDGYRIVSIVKTAPDTLSALCNDVSTLNGARAGMPPAEMIFSFKRGKLQFESYHHLKMSDVQDMTDVRITDAVQSGPADYYMSVRFAQGVNQYVNVYKCHEARVVASRTVEKAEAVRLWGADAQSVVLSSETPFAPGSQKRYYEIQVLDKDLTTVRKYPETLQYLDSNATDRLVELSYRPAYHIGMVARQVQDVQGVNRLNWFAFNSYPTGTYNKIIGETSNLLIGANTVHPAGERVLFNYAWPGSNQNNWVVSESYRTDAPHHSLILSVETFGGLELVRDTFGQAKPDVFEKLKTDPGLLKTVGVADIDPRHPEVKCFAAGTAPELYVVHNRPRKTLQKEGIVISKYVLNTADERLGAAYLTTKYGREIYYDNKPVTAADGRKWVLVGLAEDDPLYPQREGLMNAELRLQGDLSPVENTWYWQGDVKLKGKKYHLTRAVMAVQNGNG